MKDHAEPRSRSSATRACLALFGALSLATAQADSVVLSVGQTAFTHSEVREWLERRSAIARADASASAAAKPEALRDALLQMALLTERGREVMGAAGGRVARDEVLSAALERKLRADSAPSEEQISAFFMEHRARYEEPRALRLWRILVPDEALAKSIIEQVDGNPKAVYLWGDLTREHSLDAATKHRDGSLGFVREDGSTDVPELRVAKELFLAADAVKDGQLVPEPVREGSNFAVIWRKGVRGERARTLAQEHDSIKEILTRTQARATRAKLLEELRAKHLRDYAPGELPAIAMD